ncbi:SpoIIE family protein phosphatase [Hydrogenimonas urashimensis]|uniref:SpoIIE family protein phosphatase n=1 Tax=Hydrogenimonas urashimensis TaxID=2740515 RepID=UPI0019155BAB|nr:SpoIIE family protein phosphatase [Hydrogenimonas urashimensis]
MSILRFKLDSIRKKIIFYIVVITIPFFLTSLVIIDEYIGGELQISAMQRAHIANLNILQSIQSFLNRTSRYAVEAAYIVEADPDRYERVLPLIERGVALEDAAFGSALALEPGGLSPKPYCRYFYKTPNGVAEKELLPPAYDYLHAAWYTAAKYSGQPRWGDPYFDKGGGNVYMSTYSHPIFDITGRFLGVTTVDIALGKLARYMDGIAQMDEGFVFLVTYRGFMLYHPDAKVRFRETLEAYARQHHSPSLAQAARKIARKKFGIYNITLDGIDYMLYTMGIPQTTWVVGVMLRRDALFSPLTGMRVRMGLITFIGMMLILIVVLMVSKQLESNAASQERVRNELALASGIQQSFLPKKEELVQPPFALAGMMRPAKEVGGDFYGYRIEEDKLLFYIGDVSGKGVPASLFMMAAKVLIEAAADERLDPAYIMTRTNRKLCDLGEQQMFATLLIGLVDASEEKVTFAIAGHPPFIVKEGGRLASPLPRFAPPISAFEFAEYENQALPLSKKSVIVAFTDGVSEAENSRLEMFGVERLSRAIVQAHSDDPVLIKRSIVRKIETFVDDNEPNDDLTLIVITLTGEAHA